MSILETLIRSNEDRIIGALYQDLKKPKQEAFATEIAVLLDEIRFVKAHLAEWMRPQKVKTPLFLQPAKSEIHREPLGVVLIIAPWNYPFQLMLMPLISAIAAGNCAVLKPSEMAKATSELIAKLIGGTFAPEYIQVVQGGVAETTELLKNKFDHIFFTGSPAVGRVVMEAAAKTLTPVTLELGGKSPAIVTNQANLPLAARRITWGKFMNAGQTCVAPDYVYVHESVSKMFLAELKKCIHRFYGENPRSSASYARIINTRHFDRLTKLIEGKKPTVGGDHDRDDLYIAPTVITDVDWNDPVMNEEIFGPILPVLTYSKLEEVFQAIRKHDKPLAAYFFTQDQREQERLINGFSFGGGCVNDVSVHLGNPNLPFGGVGPSGFGAYHGEKGFLTFSHEKSILCKSRMLDVNFRYPPYTEKTLTWIRRAFRL